VQGFIKNVSNTLICSLIGLAFSSQVLGWNEQVGSGTINGKDFPIAVVRNAGSAKEFYGALQKRFGEKAKIGVTSHANGYQFLVQLFDTNNILHMPFNKDSAALEQYVINNSMSFTLFNIDGEHLAVGSPIAPFIEAVPGETSHRIFPALKNKIKNATEITFKFANIEIMSISGEVSADLYDMKLATRSMFQSQGLQRVDDQQENSILNRNDYEFFMDGKNNAANVAYSHNHKAKEVTVNVNQIKVH